MRLDRTALAFAAVGAINTVCSRLYYAPRFLAENGWPLLLKVLLVQFIVYTIIGAGLFAALRGGRASPALVLRRPLRFVLVLTAASALLSWLAWAMEASIWAARPILRGQDLPDFVEGWLAIMLWGGLFGWLYLLNLQRREDRTRLNGMLAERALLARQIAQAELLAARARIDPVAVAMELRAVQARYAAVPGDGAALLDQLIGRLRLALNRGK